MEKSKIAIVEISQLSSQTILVIEALRALGKERIDATVIAQLAKRLKDNDKDIILSEATACSEWIYETIRKVYDISNKQGKST